MSEEESQLVTRFDDIYNLPDCRAYYHAMHESNFQNAHFAVPNFRAAASALKQTRALDNLAVLDFASGYGIGSLLLRHDISLRDVLDRYQDPEIV